MEKNSMFRPLAIFLSTRCVQNTMSWLNGTIFPFDFSVYTEIQKVFWGSSCLAFETHPKPSRCFAFRGSFGKIKYPFVDIKKLYIRRIDE